MSTYLNDKHTKYVIIRRFCDDAKVVQIFDELKDTTIATEHDFKPLDRDTKIDNFYKRLANISKEVKDKIIEEWAKNLSPYSQKKKQIDEAVSIYKNTTDANVKLKALRLIHDIVGEDKRLKALEKSGSTVNINFQDELLKRLLSTDEQTSSSDQK
jgi:esterase/lipase